MRDRYLDRWPWRVAPKAPAWLHPSCLRILAGPDQWRRARRALAASKVDVAAIVSRRGRLVGLLTKAHDGDHATGLQPIASSAMWFMGDISPQQYWDRFIRAISGDVPLKTALASVQRRSGFLLRQPRGGVP